MKRKDELQTITAPWFHSQFVFTMVTDWRSPQKNSHQEDFTAIPGLKPLKPAVPQPWTSQRKLNQSIYRLTGRREPLQMLLHETMQPLKQFTSKTQRASRWRNGGNVRTADTTATLSAMINVAKTSVVRGESPPSVSDRKRRQVVELAVISASSRCAAETPTTQKNLRKLKATHSKEVKRLQS